MQDVAAIRALSAPSSVAWPLLSHAWLLCMPDQLLVAAVCPCLLVSSAETASTLRLMRCCVTAGSRKAQHARSRPPLHLRAYLCLWCLPDRSRASPTDSAPAARCLCSGRLGLLQPLNLGVRKNARQRDGGACAAGEAVVAWPAGSSSGSSGRLAPAVAGAPRMFFWDMGFWKMMTEATITITRFRQLPMEWVTGDTRCRIMYDTCAAPALGWQARRMLLAQPAPERSQPPWSCRGDGRRPRGGAPPADTHGSRSRPAAPCA